MRRLWVVALLSALLACKGKKKEPDLAQLTDEPLKEATYVVSPSCKQAIANAPNLPASERPALLIHDCEVCGEWKPILEWSLTTTRREQLQSHLERCNAFCTGDSKMKFMAGAENAAGTTNDTPWRRLADACTGSVSASTDHRFMSASYFALDRIARAVATDPDTDPNKLSLVEIPMPALSVAGTGVILSTAGTGPGVIASNPVAPAAPELAITLLGDQILVANLPFAKLDREGIQVTMGKEPYPGNAVALADLPKTLTAMTGGEKSKWVALLAPSEMSASKLVPVIAAAAPVVSLHMAVAAPQSPPGWQLPAVLAAELSIDPNGVQVTADTPVQKLVAMLVANGSGKLKGQ